MEEAYSELYEQFLRLRSLCLRQAALLQQLTAALQKQQGVPNGELNDMMSIPIQCTQQIPVCLHEKPQPLTATARSSAALQGEDRLCGAAGLFSDLLAEDMSKLCVDFPLPRKDDGTLEQAVAPLLSTDVTRYQVASLNVPNNPGPAHHHHHHHHHHHGDCTMHTVGMPATHSPSLGGDVLSPTGGMLMSDVALQSHVCEFCQAVFPGDSTTRGEFLRHLYTHVT